MRKSFLKLTRNTRLDELAYLAGLFDGEGSIELKKGKSKSGVSPFYTFRISIATTSMEMLQWLVDKFGGNFYVGRPKSDKHKKAFHWYVGAFDSERLLKAILPYLVIKRQLADVAMKYRATFRVMKTQLDLSISGVENQNTNGTKYQRWIPLDATTIVQRNELIMEARVLSKKGPN